MERVAFESLLVAENFIFINRLVVQVGGKKKGGKSQDISEILSIWENDKTRVENAYHTLKITREQRAKNFFAFVAQIPAKWKIIIDFLAQTPHIKEEVQDAIDFIDDLFPIFKK
ncbi:MAG: hypothetical protein H6553_06640 [Chitinophagales bacterium]|nr:hypothetical protein [Chitinophagales bacterium]